MVDLDPTLGQQLLDVPIRQAVPEIPADRDRDHLWWERNPANADRSTFRSAARGRRIRTASSTEIDRHYAGSADATDSLCLGQVDQDRGAGSAVLAIARRSEGTAPASRTPLTTMIRR